jgi:hypothetical protein
MLKKLPDIWGFRFFLNNRSIGKLILKSLLLLAIPYGYLMLCGLLFDALLKWYSMVNFIFISSVVLLIIALALIAWAVVRYTKERRGVGSGTGRN